MVFDNLIGAFLCSNGFSRSSSTVQRLKPLLRKTNSRFINQTPKAATQIMEALPDGKSQPRRGFHELGQGFCPRRDKQKWYNLSKYDSPGSEAVEYLTEGASLANNE